MVVCPVCGEENPDRARFCLACGAAIGAREEEAAEERKLVTVLFAELVGIATAAGQMADPEELKRWLDPFHARVREQVANFGGTVDKLMGPTVLAVFGAPVAHEDDPERAIRVALNVRDAVVELAEAEGGPGLGVRFGANTGEAVVARPGTGPQIGEAVTGDVVNTASRLQGLSGPGDIVVGRATHDAAAFAFSFEELPPVTVKGKADPVQVWRVIEALSRFGVDLRPRPSTPFVGRREERDLLEGAFRRTIADRTVQLVTTTGEAGVGKTRLIQELSQVADEHPDLVRWRQGRCLPYGDGVGYWALGEIVKAEAGILESDAPDVAAAKLTTAVERNLPDASERDWMRSRLAPLAGLEGASLEVDRDELFTAWRRFLEALSTRTPAVFVFEDLQWADEGLLAFIEHLVDWAVGLAMLVVCTARPELYERHPEWAGGRRNATSIALLPLSNPETSMLLSALLDGELLPPEVQAAVLERCGGNPLYAEEFARMLRDRELETTEALRGAEIPMPGSLQLLIGARLDTLTAEEKALLQDAAVIGKVFWVGALRAIAGLEEEIVTQRLHEAVQREFIRPVRASSVQGQSEYAFLHALVQEVAYGQIPRAARAAKHVAVARWIRDVAGDRVFDVAEVISHHYDEALELTRTAATGLDVAELEAAAGSALMMAGDRARRLDPQRAVGFYRRAREVLPHDDPERIRALLEAAEAGEDAGRFEEARADFELAIAEAAGDDLARGEAMARMARSVSIHGDQAHSLLEAGIRLLETRDPGSELARAYGLMAGHLYVAGDYATSIDWAEKALALADELGLEDEIVLALQYRGGARGLLGDAGGLEDLREALRRAKKLGLGNETAVAYNNYALQLWLWEGPAASLAVWDEMAAFCRVRGFQTLWMWARGGALEVLFDLGEWDQVLRICQEMLAWDREHGPTRVGITALTYEGWVHVRRGGTERAAEVLDELIPRAREIGYAEYLGPVMVLAAEVALARDDARAALAFAEGFVEVTEDQADVRTMLLPVAERILVRVGAVDRAEELLDSGSPTSSRNRLALLSARAIVAEARGDLETAAGLYRESAVRWGEYRFHLECAHVTLGAARCLLRLGSDEAQAERLLEEARVMLGRLGARPLLDEVEAIARRGPARVG